jgi:non-ribosomal peptide synthetase-like protein
MTLLWIALLPAAVTAAWIRYRQVVAHNPCSPSPEPTLTQSYPSTPWGTHQHQHGSRWLHDIFERSAAQYPEFTALSVPETGESLTYAELDQLANQLASVIGDSISQADQIVAVHLPQDSAAIVALHLAILKAGATQCFIDPDAPDDLLFRVLSDARPALLISNAIPVGYAGDCLSPEVLLRQAQTGSSRAPSAPWLNDPQARLASLFYTSGTTGHPKGVECPHAGYINLAQSYATFYDFVPGSDASSLTSSLGYDGSISEMYSAWVAGCEVVLLTKSALRSGPDLLPVLRDAQVTALFCPPVLLSTLTAHPERDLPYPICRYVVPAGEAFPASLIEPWSRARRQIVNTYGPTEVSTDTSRQLLRPNEPVTIGSPFPGVSYTIVDPDTLTPLPHGEEGELFIGGTQLARGYRNLPEVSSERFIEHPALGPIYRSGDRCHVDSNTLRVHFHGRIDAQLKVRGYRVEAQPIESLLQDQFADIETAILDCQDNELVALLRAPALWSEVTPTANIQPLNHGLVGEAQQLISAQFPPYAVPSRFFVVNQFELVPASGKINRRALPSVADIAQFDQADTTVAASVKDDGSQSLPMKVLTLCRAELGPTLDWHDDFIDWGAHSIAIARLTQQLQTAGYPVSVRGLLSETRTAAAIAQLPTHVEDPQEAAEPVTPGHGASEAVSTATRSYGFNQFTALQAMAAILLRLPLLLMAALGLAIIDPEELLLIGDILGFMQATIIAYCVYMIVPFVNLGWVLLLRGTQATTVRAPNIAPGRYQKFSSHHLQLWWLEQQAGFVLKPLVKGLRSPVLFNWALKRLGADIHPKAFIAQSTEWYGPLSLISIEPEAVVQAGVQISSVRWEGNDFILDTVRVGHNARVGSRAMLSGGASLGHHSWLTPLSSLDTKTDPHSQISGVPGTKAGDYQPPKRPHLAPSSALTEAVIDFRNVATQFALELGLVIIPGALIALLTTWFLGFEALSKVNLDAKMLTGRDLLVMSGSGVIGIWLGVLTSSMILCTFLRFTPTPPGWTRAASLRGTLARYRQTKMNQIQQMWGWSLTGQYLRALAGVKFSQVGASECDELVNLLPEHLHADANVFIAQGCFCNVLDEHGAFLLTQPIRMPAGFFGSNNAMIEPGPVPGNLLLGVSTPLGPHLYRPQYTDRPDPKRVLAGNPPLEIGAPDPQSAPKHPVPSLGIFLARFLLNDLASVGIIPGITIFLAAGLLVSLNIMGFSNVGAALITSIIVPLSMPLLALLVKLALVGNRWGRHNSAPFWSVRHFTYFLAQDCFFRLMTGFMATVSGTALANPILRRFGCRIGQRTLIGLPLQMSDWHAVDIGDDCVVNGQMQLHSFEDRVLTVSRSRIGDGAAINYGTMLMGGAHLDAGVTVDPQSLVLKAMNLEPGVHAGSPTQRIR